jgi:hypothetical protein
MSVRNVAILRSKYNHFFFDIQEFDPNFFKKSLEFALEFAGISSTFPNLAVCCINMLLHNTLHSKVM